MTRLAPHRLRAALLLLLWSAAAIAQDEDTTPDYHVEVIVVAHNEPFAAGESFMLNDRVFGDASALPDSDDDAQLPPRIGTFERLAAEDFELGETARRLGNASRFRVLGHFGWKQDAAETADAQAKGVSSGDTDGRVNGNILLSRSRYLRLDLDLKFADGGETVTLRQTRRRVQTGKPHYIDHPYFGVIVQVTRAPST